MTSRPATLLFPVPSGPESGGESSYEINFNSHDLGHLEGKLDGEQLEGTLDIEQETVEEMMEMFTINKDYLQYQDPDNDHISKPNSC
ncbi:unnamed protein product [Rhizoctonia solani]|uniref:Uncharacterized protein n=1 Tax=Rhizoctonia solani TaxID=456999 RepID=A0A8H2ZXB1_9AGAM|nr:unnamed protein product [Rhizoctonia solani]